MQEPQTPLLAVQFETDRVQSEEQSGDHEIARVVKNLKRVHCRDLQLLTFLFVCPFFKLE